MDALPDQPRRRPTQSERRLKTERLVLDAALQLVAAQGSRGLSLAQVGELSGYSRGIVNHHFGTREALIAALPEAAATKFALPATSLTGMDLLKARCSWYLDGLRDLAPAGQAGLLMWAEGAGGEPTLRAAFIERDRRFRAEISGDVAMGIEAGVVSADVDPEVVAVILLGQLRGIGLELMITPDAAPHEAITTHVLLLLDALLA